MGDPSELPVILFPLPVEMLRLTRGGETVKLVILAKMRDSMAKYTENCPTIVTSPPLVRGAKFSTLRSALEFFGVYGAYHHTMIHKSTLPPKVWELCENITRPCEYSADYTEFLTLMILQHCGFVEFSYLQSRTQELGLPKPLLKLPCKIPMSKKTRTGLTVLRFDTDRYRVPPFGKSHYESGVITGHLQPSIASRESMLERRAALSSLPMRKPFDLFTVEWLSHHKNWSPPATGKRKRDDCINCDATLEKLQLAWKSSATRQEYDRKFLTLKGSQVTSFGELVNWLHKEVNQCTFSRNSLQDSINRTTRRVARRLQKTSNLCNLEKTSLQLMVTDVSRFSSELYKICPDIGSIDPKVLEARIKILCKKLS